MVYAFFENDSDFGKDDIEISQTFTDKYTNIKTTIKFKIGAFDDPMGSENVHKKDKYVGKSKAYDTGYLKFVPYWE